jgi:hypothetical protein
MQCKLSSYENKRILIFDESLQFAKVIGHAVPSMHLSRTSVRTTTLFEQDIRNNNIIIFDSKRHREEIVRRIFTINPQARVLLVDDLLRDEQVSQAIDEKRLDSTYTLNDLRTMIQLALIDDQDFDLLLSSYCGSSSQRFQRTYQDLGIVHDGRGRCRDADSLGITNQVITDLEAFLADEDAEVGDDVMRIVMELVENEIEATAEPYRNKDALDPQHVVLEKQCQVGFDLEVRNNPDRISIICTDHLGVLSPETVLTYLTKPMSEDPLSLHGKGIRIMKKLANRFMYLIKNPEDGKDGSTKIIITYFKNKSVLPVDVESPSAAISLVRYYR